jgi:hypothetical protein
MEGCFVEGRIALDIAKLSRFPALLSGSYVALKVNAWMW